jgi:multimeric flavodoxin WrbA
MQIEASNEHLLNVCNSILLSVDGDSKTTLASALQFMKQEDPIVTDEPIRNDVSEWQSQKAKSSIRRRFDPGLNVSEVREGQWRKHSRQIVWTLGRRQIV